MGWRIMAFRKFVKTSCYRRVIVKEQRALALGARNISSKLVLSTSRVLKWYLLLSDDNLWSHMPVNLEIPVSGQEWNERNYNSHALPLWLTLRAAVRLVASYGLLLVTSVFYFEHFISYRNSSYGEVVVFFSNKI